MIVVCCSSIRNHGWCALTSAVVVDCGTQRIVVVLVVGGNVVVALGNPKDTERDRKESQNGIDDPLPLFPWFCCDDSIVECCGAHGW